MGESKEKETKIGARIRALRKSQGITLTEMSEKTELSTGFLSKLENDQTSPTLVHLHRICEALGITINDILSDGIEKEKPSVIRASERNVIFTDGRDVSYEAVTEGDTSVKVSAMRLLSDRICESYPHSHDELGIVLTGRVRITVDGITEELGPGDSIYIKSGSAHSLQRVGGKECICYWIKPSSMHDEYGCHIR